MKNEISAIMGGVISDEVNKLLENFVSNSEMIENNFTILKQKIDNLEKVTIGAKDHVID